MGGEIQPGRREAGLCMEVIAMLPPGRQNAAGEGDRLRLSVATTPGQGDEGIAPRREGGRDDSLAIASIDRRSK